MWRGSGYPLQGQRGDRKVYELSSYFSKLLGMTNPQVCCICLKPLREVDWFKEGYAIQFDRRPHVGLRMYVCSRACGMRYVQDSPVASA